MFLMCLTDKLSCTEFLDFLNPQTLYGWSVKTSWTAPFRTGALASKLLARTSPVHLHFCGLKYGLHACNRAAALISRVTGELPLRSLVIFRETCTIAKSE